MKKLFVIAAFLWMASASAQQYQINVKPAAQPEAIALPFASKSPSGHSLAVNNQYFMADGKPVYPVMGEMHYNRVPPAEWETEIQKMKSAGLTIVATYVFWNEHETSLGIWDWKGNRNLRRFIQLCAQNNMKVWLRIGPWSHGEQLNGGFPNWIQQLKGHRSNNEAYLKASNLLFQQIGLQTKGLYFVDGGPIIGTQLENEYASGQAAHISKLKELAMANNISPVYWSITANTVFNDSKLEVIPLQGSYPYRGWERGGGKATKDFLYGDDEWIMTDGLGKVFYDVHRFPKGMCEQGCGSQMTYANRFVVEPAVVAAHLQNQIGRGMNLMGYYMFHGGTQTPGLEEPGLPRSYDFQSPIDEFGFVRPSYKQLRVYHHFVNDFGADLVKMQVFEPENPLRDEKNTEQLRYVVRSDGQAGFLFLGNTQVRIQMTDKDIQVNVNLANETIAFPKMVLKGQTSPILPFNMPIGTALLKYATAQPMARMGNGKETTLFFELLDGVPAQFAFDASSIELPVAKGWQLQKTGKQLVLQPNGSRQLKLRDKKGNTFTLVLLSAEEAQNAWRGKVDGKEALLLTSATILQKDNQFVFEQLENPKFKIRSYPKGLKTFAGQAKQPDAVFDVFAIATKSYEPQVQLNETAQNNARLVLPSALPANISNIMVKVDYLGGMCKLFQNGEYLTDNLYNGTTWQIGLRRFMGKGDVELKIEDWSDKITGIPASLVNEIKQQGNRFVKIKAVPQYQIVIDKK